MRKFIAGAALVLALAGCNDNGRPRAGRAPAPLGDVQDPSVLAAKLGCADSYEDRASDIGYPYYMTALGMCTMNGHSVFFTIVKTDGMQAALRGEAKASPEANHYVSAANWQVDIPDAAPGEIRAVFDRLGIADRNDTAARE